VIWGDDLDRLAEEVGPYAQRFRKSWAPTASGLADVLAAAEELGELAEQVEKAQLGIIRAGLKGFHGQREGDWDAEMEKELGDAIIAVVALCYHQGRSPTDVVAKRWEEVRKR
jgi:NTP pyrophosphatase (non-canonical NTP hydrolase)